MKIISFINRKGGSGKSTNAMNTANAFRQHGFQTALVETDNNNTLVTLRHHEEQQQQQTALLKTVNDNVAKVLTRLQEQMYEIAIIDGAANMDPDVCRLIASRSDIVIVPTSLSPQDLLVTDMTVKSIAPVMQMHPRLKICVLANRIHHFCLYETVAHQLAPLGVPVMNLIIPNLKEYTEVSTQFAATGYKRIVTLILNMLAEQRPAALGNHLHQPLQEFRHYKICTNPRCGKSFGTNNDKRETCSEACKKAKQRALIQISSLMLSGTSTSASSSSATPTKTAPPVTSA